MFEAAVSGARTDEIEGVEVVVRPALTAAAVDVLEADAYLLGTPVTIVLGTRHSEPARPGLLGVGTAETRQALHALQRPVQASGSPRGQVCLGCR